MNNTIIIGSRGSELALWQAYHVQARLQKKYKNLDVQIKIIKTKGDKIQDQALSVIGDKGLFTKEIEQALFNNKIDLAVHSLKDLQTQVPEGLQIAAITKREKANDVLISRQWKSLSDLPEGAIIATGSLRRQSQLKHLRPDLNIIDIRGNLNTRFKKFDKSKWDGMILAYAGVERLGWRDRIAHIIPTHHLLPAVGQGALGIEIREEDTDTLKRLAFLNHEATLAAATAERTLMRELEGGCQVPIGAFARVEQGTLILDAMVGNLDGSLRLDARSTSSRLSGAQALGKRVARKLIDNGAVAILDEIRSIALKA